MSYHQLRGGSWLSPRNSCDSTGGPYYEIGSFGSHFGFRVVCNKESPPPDKTLCGGSWYSLPRLCRSADRSHLEPGYAAYSFGFRVVCSTPNQSNT